MTRSGIDEALRAFGRGSGVVALVLLSVALVAGITARSGRAILLPRTGLAEFHRGCGLRATADILGYLAAQSSGRCGPCRNGLPQLATRLNELARGGSGDPAEILRLAGSVDGRDACHHPDGAARLARSALSVFADDLAMHRHGSCDAAPHPDAARDAVALCPRSALSIVRKRR
ncbi:NADH-ubiquinone oxidoreductase-F iron-sulfur binding region domain-containing protein [Nocardia spumae]|uniref:NADH-ubiquinone oxidoreductase-F iron-sulfur binding region domain-containing protein n=1 Tax=Nocardia spumae TaxID=2887190 RepID=UPI001D156F4E|nr:NADH-ubiquinone oxidoreductase-F iron-sulfur binding region domain-containing protein [Nocardia spumae]